MSQTIHKYPLELVDLQTVPMPSGARVLCVQVQRDAPCLWAMVHPENPTELRTIEIFGTRREFPEIERQQSRGYVGTFQQHDGELVWHVFERGNLPGLIEDKKEVVAP